jgi:hypothetical protein
MVHVMHRKDLKGSGGGLIEVLTRNFLEGLGKTTEKLGQNSRWMAWPRF